MPTVAMLVFSIDMLDTKHPIICPHGHHTRPNEHTHIVYAYMGVVLYSFARDWALGPRLRGTCAYLRAHSGAETRFR